MRYASLHRAIERGAANDDIWNELARTCVSLGFHDEAVRAYRRVEAPHKRRSLTVLLSRHGLINPTEDSDEGEAAGPPNPQILIDDSRSDLGQQLGDALHFLFLEHMPLTVIAATLTFPLVIGLGGFLTAGSSFFLLPAIALIPGLVVLGAIGAISRRIMLEAGQGIYDPPPLPEIGELKTEATRFLTNTSVLALALLGPGIALYLLSSHLGASISALALGMLLMPMAMIIRELSEDWRALSPTVLLRAVGRGGPSYLKMSLVIFGLMLPALLSCLATMGTHIYLQIAVMGPLSVVPIFVAARLLGNFFHANSAQLQELVGQAEQRAAEADRARTDTGTVEEAAPGAPAPARKAPVRRAARPAQGSAPARSRPASSRPTQRAPAPRPQARPGVKVRRGGPRMPARPRTAGTGPNPPRPPAGAPARPKPQVRRSRPQRAGVDYPAPPQPRYAANDGGPDNRPAGWLDDMPDLSNMPGARIVNYSDREREGASSSPK